MASRSRSGSRDRSRDRDRSGSPRPDRMVTIEEAKGDEDKRDHDREDNHGAFGVWIVCCWHYFWLVIGIHTWYCFLGSVATQKAWWRNNRCCVNKEFVVKSLWSMVNGVDTQKSCEIAERAEQMRALFSRDRKRKCDWFWKKVERPAEVEAAVEQSGNGNVVCVTSCKKISST